MAQDRARLAADVQRTAVFVLNDGNDTRIAREPAARFRGNARAVLEPAATGGFVSQRFRGNVDDLIERLPQYRV
jgi:hypothetical protein